MIGKTFRMLPNGSVYQAGVHVGQADPHVIAVNEKHRTVVVHEKGTHYWAGIGLRDYAQAEVTVYMYGRIEAQGDGLIFHAPEDAPWNTGFPVLAKYSPNRKNAISKVLEWLAKRKEK